MTLDFALDSKLASFYNSRGDAARVTDERAIAQSIMASVVSEVGLAAPPLTDDGIENRRSDIVSAVRTNPLVDAPFRVVVRDTDFENKSVTYLVDTPNVTVPIETT